MEIGEPHLTRSIILRMNLNCLLFGHHYYAVHSDRVLTILSDDGVYIYRCRRCGQIDID